MDATKPSASSTRRKRAKLLSIHQTLVFVDSSVPAEEIARLAATRGGPPGRGGAATLPPPRPVGPITASACCGLPPRATKPPGDAAVLDPGLGPLVSAEHLRRALAGARELATLHAAAGALVPAPLGRLSPTVSLPAVAPVFIAADAVATDFRPAPRVRFAEVFPDAQAARSAACAQTVLEHVLHPPEDLPGVAGAPRSSVDPVAVRTVSTLLQAAQARLESRDLDIGVLRSQLSGLASALAAGAAPGPSASPAPALADTRPARPLGDLSFPEARAAQSAAKDQSVWEHACYPPSPLLDGPGAGALRGSVDPVQVSTLATVLRSSRAQLDSFNTTIAGLHALVAVLATPPAPLLDPRPPPSDEADQLAHLQSLLDARDAEISRLSFQLRDRAHDLRSEKDARCADFVLGTRSAPLASPDEVLHEAPTTSSWTPRSPSSPLAPEPGPIRDSWSPAGPAVPAPPAPSPAFTPSPLPPRPCTGPAAPAPAARVRAAFKFVSPHLPAP